MGQDVVGTGKLTGQEGIRRLAGQLQSPANGLGQGAFPAKGDDLGPVGLRMPERSRLTQSGMKMVTGWPRLRPRAAKAMPVLPLVTSMIGAATFSSPF